MILNFILFFSAASYTAAHDFSIPNVAATFKNSPTPFKLRVDPKFIEDTRRRVEITRAPHSIGAFGDGPSIDNLTTIRDYWINEYNWEKTQDSINRK